MVNPGESMKAMGRYNEWGLDRAKVGYRNARGPIGSSMCRGSPCPMWDAGAGPKPAVDPVTRWMVYFFLSLPMAVLGLLGAGFVANAAVRWYRVSSFEGKSGFFVIGWALAAGVVAFLASLVILGMLRPQAPNPPWPETKASYRFRVRMEKA